MEADVRCGAGSHATPPGCGGWKERKGLAIAGTEGARSPRGGLRLQGNEARAEREYLRTIQGYSCAGRLSPGDMSFHCRRPSQWQGRRFSVVDSSRFARLVEASTRKDAKSLLAHPAEPNSSGVLAVPSINSTIVTSTAVPGQQWEFLERNP